MSGSHRFVCWLWPSRTRDFAVQHVNVLRNMLARFCDLEQLICITDDPSGLDKRIEHFPMPATGVEHVSNPEQLAYPNKKFPTCYRRLWLFSQAAKALGDKLVCIDIDVVILRECADLFDHDADFVGWSDPEAGWCKIAGGLFMIKPGSNRFVWDEFDPEQSPAKASAAGYRGSDQGWISYCLHPLSTYWTNADGLLKIRHCPRQKKEPPENVRIAFTTGHLPPWSLRTKRDYPWIREYWH